MCVFVCVCVWVVVIVGVVGLAVVMGGRGLAADSQEGVGLRYGGEPGETRGQMKGPAGGEERRLIAEPLGRTAPRDRVLLVSLWKEVKFWVNCRLEAHRRHALTHTADTQHTHTRTMSEGLK